MNPVAERTADLMMARQQQLLILAACVPLLLVIGAWLFYAGASGKITIAAQISTWQAKLTNLSPGLVCFVLAVVLGHFVLSKDITISSTVRAADGSAQLQQLQRQDYQPVPNDAPALDPAEVKDPKPANPSHK